MLKTLIFKEIRYDDNIEEALKLFDLPRIIGEYENKEVIVGVGRFGPYIAFKGTNYKIPKDVVPQDLNLATCFEIVRIQDEKPATPKRGRYAKKK